MTSFVSFVISLNWRKLCLKCIVKTKKLNVAHLFFAFLFQNFHNLCIHKRQTQEEKDALSKYQAGYSMCVVQSSASSGKYQKSMKLIYRLTLLMHSTYVCIYFGYFIVQELIFSIQVLNVVLQVHIKEYTFKYYEFTITFLITELDILLHSLRCNEKETNFTFKTLWIVFLKFT